MTDSAEKAKAESSTFKAGKKRQKMEEDPDADLTEEELALKNKLEALVDQIASESIDAQKAALESVRNEIRSATTTMTSVPKPLKFLRSHYGRLKEAHSASVKPENAAELADIISILAPTCAEEGQRDTLKYRLLGSNEPIGSWGHEYLRNLTSEITAEYPERRYDAVELQPLLDLVEKIVPYHMSHNAEPEAVDLLIEVDRLPWIEKYVDEGNYRRTCLYLTSCCQYLAEPDDSAVLKAAFNIYMQKKSYHDGMRVALRLNDMDLINQAFASCDDVLKKRQLGYLLARQGVVINLESGPAMVENEELRSSLQETISNSNLNEYFLELARDLDVMEPKVPDDVYKMHLVEGRTPSSRAVDSARHNLASTFVNGFVNAGFGQDKLITATESESSQPAWIFRNRDHGKMSATASLGMITMWNVDGGLSEIDKYLYSNDNYVIAGALLAIGLPLLSQLA